MDLSDIFRRGAAWLDESGPENDIVISSRVRFARNIAGYNFFRHADVEQQRAVLELVREKLLEGSLGDQLAYVPMREVSELDRQVLRERNLISRELAGDGGPRAVAVVPDETVAVMINEEDHVRLQVIANGLRLRETCRRACELDDELEGKLDYAFEPDYGYLTACPTNVGTGMRASVMLHLPALKMTGEIDKLFRAAKELKLAVRGLYGEGSEPVGDFYQLSNQVTLGMTEEQIVEELTVQAVEPMVEYERRARRKLVERRPLALDDKVFRALGVLTHARMLTSEESLYLLSYVRLGVHMGRIKDVAVTTVNRLCLSTQPAHLQRYFGDELDPGARDHVRADFVRRELGTPPGGGESR